MPTINIAFSGGLNNKADPRLLEPPELSSCVNAQFTETGGVQKCRPYTALSTDVLGGGTIPSNIRRIVAYGDELLAFTQTKLYSWAPSQTKWVLRGVAGYSYYAPKLKEKSVLINNQEQVSADRAELSNVIFYTWVELGASSVFTVKLAAVDKTTGALLYGPTTQGTAASANVGQPKLIALYDKVLFFMRTAANTLSVKSISPTDITTGADGSFTSVATTLNGLYDVCAKPDQGGYAFVVWKHTTTTTYGYADVTSTPTVTASTKARTCDGAIAVSRDSGTGSFAIIRGVATNVRGDIIDSSFVDVVGAFNIDMGNAAADPTFIAVTWISSTKCVAIWTSQQTGTAATAYYSKSSSLTTSGVAAEATSLMYRLCLASRAFTYNSEAFCWFATAPKGTVYTGSELQNNYILYRIADLAVTSQTDQVVAKATPFNAGGFPNITGMLPNVQDLGSSVFAWCGAEKRLIPLDVNRTTSNRGPREIICTMDSDDARRVAVLGKTLYISGGQITQYDGRGFVELGFHQWPHYCSAADTAGAVDVSYLATLAWENAQGEIERSAPSDIHTVQTAADGDDVVVSLGYVSATNKGLVEGISGASYEVWRTLQEPTVDSPFYLTTSKDPTATGTNGYVSNAPLDSNVNFTESFTDATLDDQETLYLNGSILESVAPPAATILSASTDRLFIAGISYDPNLIWYSKLRGDGELAQFNDTLKVSMPPTGGDITSLAFLGDLLVVFKETAIYALPGNGFDNLGGGSNYGPPRLLSIDTGVTSHDTVVVMPQGLMFFSKKGWYLLDRTLTLRYIGSPVEDYNTNTYVCAVLLEKEHQVRCLATDHLLVYDYEHNAWSYWDY